jgi:hypothetical protein
MNYRRIATFTGWLWIITFVTSIPARFFFYAPVLDHEGNYVTGARSDAQTLIAIGAVLELLLIISNVGTAVVPYSIHKRVHEAGAVAYVAARLVGPAAGHWAGRGRSAGRGGDRRWDRVHPRHAAASAWGWPSGHAHDERVDPTGRWFPSGSVGASGWNHRLDQPPDPSTALSE